MTKFDTTTKTGTNSEWRQLRDVVGALMIKIEKAPTPTPPNQQGKQR